MYFDFRTFFRVLYFSFFRSKNTSAPLTLKRLVFLLIFFTLFPLAQLFHKLCFFLDDIFFPAWRRLELVPPVFIIGNARSGTTYMHRVLAMDDEEFFFFRTWEILFPAIIQKKILSALGRLDRCLGSPGSRLIRSIESRRLKNFSKMHASGLFYPEECELLLVHIFSTYNILFFFPFDELKWFDHFDIACPAADRKRIMTFYRDCVKRQAYFKGNKGRLLSKSPGFTPKIQSLYEYFPGCKIICMVRNPLETVPSMLNLICEIRKSANLLPSRDVLDRAYELTKFYYHYPLTCFDNAPLSQHYLVKYDKLVRQPSVLVRTIYEQFNLPLGSRYAEILRGEDQKARAYRSKHVYSLGQFHITKERIIFDLKDIFDRFEFTG